MTGQKEPTSPQMELAESLKELSLVGVDLENYKKGLDIDTLTVEERLQQSHRLSSFGKLYLEKYRKSKQQEDIDLSIKSYEKAIRLVADDSGLLAYDYDYAIALFERYSLLQRPDDLESAISRVERVVEGTPEESSDFTHRSGFLSSLYYIRYQSSRTISDLSKAIGAIRKSVHANEGNEKLVSNLNNLSVFLYQRFRLSPNHDLVDISEAILYQNRLVELTTEDDDNSPFWLEKLGGLLEARFKYTGEIEDLSAAISALDKAIGISPAQDNNRIRRLGKPGTLYRHRSQYKGNAEDIFRAVEDHEEALQISPDDYSNFYELYENVGNSYLAMYHQTEDIQHVSEAVTALKNAVDLIPEDNTDAASYWSNLGTAYLRLFECKGDPQDLSDAISAQERSLQFASTDSVQLSSFYDHLGDSYQIKFEIYGNTLDISKAISAHQQAIQLMPENHILRADRLNNLGTALQCRAERTGDISDIWEAISAHREAVKLCHPDNSNLPLLLSNLGNAIFAQFKLKNDPKAIDESISLYQQALSMTGNKKTDAAVATYYDNLSIAQRLRFDLCKVENDIDGSISSAEIALNLTREGRHLDTIGRLNNLATALCKRYEHSKIPADISKAIQSLEKGIQMLPSMAVRLHI
ncbi:hypothetical protein JR316_0006543 [Psilocybe cubensis]|uniref:Uncharacterized protein n=2 Tax=Psilocybe cubensis TaxID=181762 RepID=A0A8H7XM74_PSICU|nr:hypothetical protein JR316_0006543 [Psilocybe cubensis]KAH9482013.1 hypothetical protein JR316_0006543 [Psilocybe cubensis]